MTIEEAQDRLIAEFAALDDRLEKYEALIERGKQHAPANAELHADEYAMPGCQSQVWIRPSLRGDALYFDADSDSLIIKGVLALLLRVLNGRDPGDIAEAELYFVERIGLAANLSPTRANGVASIIRHMQSCAREFSSQSRKVAS